MNFILLMKLIIKKIPNNDYHKLIYLKKIEDNLKIEEPSTQPSKIKRKSRDFSIEKKDLQKEKNKRVKKGITVGERKHELKIIVTDYGEKMIAK